MDEEFIVAQVSKNWQNGQEDTEGLLNREFAEVINAHAKRGYTLHSWQLNRVMTGIDEMNATIVAVFELECEDWEKELEKEFGDEDEEDGE